MDRDIVKDYLASVGWVTEKDGRLSMTTLSDKNVATILGKWDSFTKKLNEFVEGKEITAQKEGV